MSAGVFKALIRFFKLPNTVDILNIPTPSHFRASRCHVASATFLGAIISTLRMANREYFNSYMADNVIIVFPKPISRNSPILF